MFSLAILIILIPKQAMAVPLLLDALAGVKGTVVDDLPGIASGLGIIFRQIHRKFE